MGLFGKPSIYSGLRDCKILAAKGVRQWVDKKDQERDERKERDEQKEKSGKARKRRRAA